MFSLANRIAIVTGSSRGIGKAIAQDLAKAGASVVVCSRKVESCEQVAEEIRQGGGTALALKCNVAHKEELNSLVQSTLDHFGRIDIVVGNAATNPAYGPMHELEDDAYEKIMGTNLRSNLWLANLTCPHMEKTGGGSLIFISSITALIGSKVIGAYAISKAGEVQMARNLAIEWGLSNIRTNCIAPGLVKTEFARALWENPKAAGLFEKRSALGRIAEPSDISGVAVFLASDAARYITGQCLVADGGATIYSDF